MAESSHITQTLDEFKNELAEKLADIVSLLAMIHHLEDRIGVPRSPLPETVINFIGPSSPSQGGTTASQTIRRQAGATGKSIRPDQFLGDAPLDAAKKYLEMVGHAVHFDEIADAIQKGGAAVKGHDWRDKLEVSLVRSVYEVVKVQDKTFGLTSFYSEDQIRRLRGARARPEPAKKKKKRSKKAKAEANKDEASSE